MNEPAPRAAPNLSLGEVNRPVSRVAADVAAGDQRPGMQVSTSSVAGKPGTLWSGGTQ